MDKIILRTVFLAALLLLAPDLSAQPALPGDTPNGILADRVAPLAGLATLDGTAQADEASLSRWRQAVFELRNAASVELGWPEPRIVQEGTLTGVERNVIPLAVLHAAYDRLSASGQVEQGLAFAFAPLRKVNYFPHETRLLIPRAALLTHRVSEIVSLSLDAGDGRGFRAVEWDKPISVQYQPGGTRQLRLSARLADGRQLHATTRLEIHDGPTPPPPTETWMVTATEEWEGMAGSGQAYLYLAEGRTELTNPVVVVEGFDIDNSIDWPVLYDLLNQENLLEDLRAMDYDAVVLDFTEAVEPIQRNAFVLTRLLEMVHAEIAPAQDVALVGASMGGLVSRYGLLWMEDQGADHRVRNFISFDTPHGGANIPLGLQHWVRFFADQSEDAQFFLDRLSSDAARQMLLYHVGSTSGTSAAPDPLAAAFAGDLATLGEWPADPRLSTVINGAGNLTGQGFSAGDQIIEWTHRGALVDIDGNVWAVPDGGGQVIFDGLIDIIFVPEETETITISDTLPWDNAPGGFRPTMDQLADVEAPYGDIIALHGAHSFIPSVNALAIDTNNPFYDIAGDANLLDHVPFDAVYFPGANQEHIDITPENKAWFISEIEFGQPTDAFFSDGFETPGQF